jgi:serine/threonine-protein kinase
MPIRDALEIVAEVLEALAAAHAVGVVHRDIKPENVFVTPGRNGTRAIKLLDFGISKVTRDGRGPLDHRSLTATGTIVGTIDYMSPEQVRGDDDVDGATDVWAVGVMLFRMLSSTLPFDGKNVNMVLLNVMTAPTPEIRALVPTLPTRVASIVMCALEKDRSKRYATASAMLADVKSALASPDALTPIASPTNPEEIQRLSDLGVAKTVERDLMEAATADAAHALATPAISNDAKESVASDERGASQASVASGAPSTKRTSRAWIGAGLVATISVAGVIGFRLFPARTVNTTPRPAVAHVAETPPLQATQIPTTVISDGLRASPTTVAETSATPAVDAAAPPPTVEPTAHPHAPTASHAHAPPRPPASSTRPAPATQPATPPTRTAPPVREGPVEDFHGT